MDSDAKPAGPPATPNERRRVGRPSTLESGGASLATVLELIRAGAATTRLGIERQAELGRAVVADRLATLERLGLIAEGELGPAIGGRAPRNVRFRADAGVDSGRPRRSGVPVGGARGSRGQSDRRASRGGRSRGRPRTDLGPYDRAVHLASRRAGRERAGLGDRNRSARGCAGGRQRGRGVQHRRARRPPSLAEL